MVSTKHKCTYLDDVCVGTFVLNNGVTTVAPTQRDQTNNASKRGAYFQTEKNGLERLKLWSCVLIGHENKDYWRRPGGIY
jgi:hypothetical protein